MSLTAYREHIRRDLKELVPSGMDVHFVRCKIVTIAAHLMNSQVDMVPADFCNVLLHYMSGLRLTDQSIAAVRGATSNGAVSPSDLVETIRRLQSREDHIDVQQSPSTTRLIDRIQEFGSCCPICWQGDRPTLKIMGCCGYVVCGDCFDDLRRCAFCRQEIPSALPRAQVTQASPANVVSLDPEEGAAPNGSPVIFPPRPQFELRRSFEQDMAQFTNHHKLQSDNLVNTLHVLMRHGYRRRRLVDEAFDDDERTAVSVFPPSAADG
jgi:hypothetical protein